MDDGAAMRDAGPGKPRLILADDHEMVVAGLSALLARNYEIAGTADCGEALLALLAHCPAHCLLLDISMPPGNGLMLIPEVKRLQPGIRILVVTMFNERTFAEAALHAGADGFLPKDGGIEELEAAIAAVLAGRRYISPRVPKTSHRLGLGAEHLAFQQLTPREQQIALLIGEGKSETDIGRMLSVGKSTVTFHKQNIMRALGLAGDEELLRYTVLVRACVGRAATPAPQHARARRARWRPRASH